MPNVVLLHGLGGTYGPAEYEPTAARTPQPPGQIRILLMNAWGIPIGNIRLGGILVHDWMKGAHTPRQWLFLKNTDLFWKHN